MDDLINNIISTFKEDTNQTEYILRYDLKRIISSYINDIREDSYNDGYEAGLKEHKYY